MASKLLEIDELIEDKLSDDNLSYDDEVIPPFFKDTMDSIEKLGTYFFCQKNNEKIFNEVTSIHNVAVNSHRQSARETTVQTASDGQMTVNAATFATKAGEMGETPTGRAMVACKNRPNNDRMYREAARASQCIFEEVKKTCR
ncbi:hypothetical protein AVEN_144673-1 [Araneus ventricosus]|uniref:Uncharacterized protein n=1 Tax=Araneus ventricosus TaxID=182803 RepID=A0A4Y2UAT8_ARAVE|nr:hypothetical protein AVEN_144673-1 [Araneus ventricosus]